MPSALPHHTSTSRRLRGQARSLVTGFVAVQLVALCVAGAPAYGAPAKAAPDSAAEQSKAIEDMAKAMQNQQSRQPIDKDKLKGLLPATFGDLARTRFKSSTQAALGFSMSMAEAEYGKGDQTAKVELSDLGPMAAMAAAVGPVEEEETDTTAMKSWRDGKRYHKRESDRESKTIEYTVMFSNGVRLEVHATGLEWPAVESAVNAIGLDKIEALAPAR